MRSKRRPPCFRLIFLQFLSFHFVFLAFFGFPTFFFTLLFLLFFFFKLHTHHLLSFFAVDLFPYPFEISFLCFSPFLFLLLHLPKKFLLFLAFPSFFLFFRVSLRFSHLCPIFGCLFSIKLVDWRRLNNLCVRLLNNCLYLRLFLR